MTHDDLAVDLAATLRGPRRMVWCDMQLGAAGSVRPDVYTIDKSFVRPSPMAYEVKVSRSDFLADVTVGKWQSYLAVACGVYFACEVGLVSKADVPAHCGLLVRHPSGVWRAAKRAVLSPVTLPQDAMIKLLIDGVEREGPAVRRRAWLGMSQDELKQRFGATVAKAIKDAEAVAHETSDAILLAQRIVEHAKMQAARIIKDAETEIAPQRVDLCNVIGLPPTANSWQIRNEIGRIRSALQQHPANRKLELAVRTLRSALEQIAPVDTTEADA